MVANRSPEIALLERIRFEFGLVSCSTAGRVTLNDDLCCEPARFRAEVIVHELLHLIVPNYGRVFKALLRTYLGSSQRVHATVDS
jgi:predicted metal-dependent hydrolase